MKTIQVEIDDYLYELLCKSADYALLTPDKFLVELFSANVEMATKDVATKRGYRIPRGKNKT